MNPSQCSSHGKNVSNGVVDHSGQKSLDNAIYSRCVMAMCTLCEGSITTHCKPWFGVKQVLTIPVKSLGYSIKPGEPAVSSPLARSSSWIGMNADSGLACGIPERSFLLQSTIYNWSCGHFSRPLLNAADDSEEVLARREEREKLALDLIAKCQRSSVSKLRGR